MIKLTEKERGEIEDLLKKIGCADYVITGGLEYLIQSWRNFVIKCKSGYSATIEEYRNDLDTRGILNYLIEEIDDQELSNAIASEIEEYDRRFRGLLVETNKCVWGEANIPRYRDKKRYWWVYGIIKTAKGTLLENLKYRDFEYYKGG